MTLSLKERLVRYLKNNPSFTASGALQRLVAEKTTYTPRTTCRRLEELVEEGVLKVEYRTKNGTRHAWYAYIEDPTKDSLDWFESLISK